MGYRNIRGIGRLDDSEYTVYRLMREMGIRPASKNEIHKLGDRLQQEEYRTMGPGDGLILHNFKPSFVDSVRETSAYLAVLPADPVAAYRQYMVRYARDGSLAMQYFYLLNAYSAFVERFAREDPEISLKALRIIELLEGRAFEAVHGILTLLNLASHENEFYASVGKMLLRGLALFRPSYRSAIVGFHQEVKFNQLLKPSFWKYYWPYGGMAQIGEFPSSELSATRLHSATPEEWNRYMTLGRTSEHLPGSWLTGRQRVRNLNIIHEDDTAPELALLPDHKLSPWLVRAIIRENNDWIWRWRESIKARYCVRAEATDQDSPKKNGGGSERSSGTQSTPALAGGTRRISHHDSATTRRRGARGLPRRSERRAAHAFVRGAARMAARA